MKLVHLSDLHLGFRAYATTERGWNQRERDLAGSFRQALQATIRLRPDLIVVTGDIFDGPDPPSTALLTFARGMSHLRANLPGVPVLVIAGRRDSPRSPANPGPVGVLDALPLVEAAASAPRAIRFRDSNLRALLVPHRATAEPPFPEISPDPAARWNVLLIRGDPSGDGSGPTIDPEAWSYVAIGGNHRHHRWAPNTWTAGALERPSPYPWREATDERGFVVFDLERGEGEFHAIPGRPVVDLAPVRVDSTDLEAGTRRLRDLVQGLPGGVDGRILQIRLRGDVSHPSEGVAAGLLGAIRRRASHLSARLEPLPSVGDASRGWHPDHLIVEDTASERSSVPLPRGGLVLLSCDSKLLPARLATETPSGAPGPAFSVDPEPPRGSVIGAVWAGPEDAESLVDLVLRATGDPPPETVPALPEPATERDELVDVESRLRELRGSAIEASGDLEAAMLEWARERQDAESKLDLYRDRARELRDRIREIETDGAHAACPTCARPLGQSAEQLLDTLRSEWEGLVQDGRWWRRRREQLDTKPDGLREMEERVFRLHAKVEEAAEEAERLRGARDRHATEPSDTVRESAHVELGEETAGLPGARSILRLSGDVLARLTSGRLAGVRIHHGHIEAVRLDGSGLRPVGDDLAALRLAVHIGCWRYARALGVGVGALLVHELREGVGDDLMRGALYVLGDLAGEGASVLVLGRPDTHDLLPEVFRSAVNLSEGPAGSIEIRVGPRGTPALSLGGAPSA